MVSLVNSHTNATRIGWHLWDIDLRFASGLPPGWGAIAAHSPSSGVHVLGVRGGDRASVGRGAAARGVSELRAGSGQEKEKLQACHDQWGGGKTGRNLLRSVSSGRSESSFIASASPASRSSCEHSGCKGTLRSGSVQGWTAQLVGLRRCRSSWVSGREGKRGV